MMDLNSAIQHCKEQVQEQAKRGCYSCAEEHQQLAEWLKELKEYREQRDGRMNEAEKERLIKKDIASIENRVRHAFNQGYEMGVKESRSEIPNTCEDAISRKAVLDLAEWFDLNRQHFIVANLIDEVENMPSVSPQQRTGRWIEALDKIRAEIHATAEMHEDGDYYLRDEWIDEIIDKYKAESEEKE